MYFPSLQSSEQMYFLRISSFLSRGSSSTLTAVESVISTVGVVTCSPTGYPDGAYPAAWLALSMFACYLLRYLSNQLLISLARPYLK
ncbi:hypothetical protein FGO68_gene15990 [Halteria grandinella]|uniref:Uncharacterized protein n=1 Tax=Halteria grandinella TaxID=5974 RepID=A0A8J8P912_HALGN|nr:hypothetical protein FGO68_gene15990 [Halteria grandinella]